MQVLPRLTELHAPMTAWRREIHTHPELAFDEHRTAGFVAERLAEFGIPVHRGLAGTGVVGTLRAGRSGRAIGLRADMDALPIEERTGLPYASTRAGVMHACGHDGHTAMLLGAACYLAETRDFDGTVHFVFQPAEEAEGGGKAMIDAGLFRRFPMDAVFGLHNWPGLPAGEFAVHTGTVMAADDRFTVTLSGRGAHAALPHQGDDPVVAAGALIGAVQTIPSRLVDSQTPAVVSITRLEGGKSWNVIPAEVSVGGTCRYLEPALGGMLEANLRQLAAGVATAHGVDASVEYRNVIPAAVNAADPARLAARAAALVAGEAKVHRGLPPSLGCEDFAFMLAERPGCYAWLGNGSAADGRTLHSARYDFNDEILPVGASYWCRVVETCLREGGG